MANANYRDRILARYLEEGATLTAAQARAEKAALRYAGKQHRFRAETIVHTELSYAYNRGADMGVRAAIRQGLMGRCEMVWTTAGTNRVCPRCLALKDTVVGHTDEGGVQIPPLHPRCRCTIAYREVAEPRINQPARPLTSPRASGNVEMPRRWRAQDGHEIIDKPTYNKLTKSFLKAGGLIIRGEDAARHLANTGATASYIANANVAFITDDATISDVLEEMYHAYQDRTKMFGEITDKAVVYKREINAQEYLLKSIDKYKIPPEETAVTLKNLKHYERLLSELIE